jgi:thiol-disulfide isomerase/thioredoxin
MKHGLLARISKLGSRFGWITAALVMALATALGNATRALAVEPTSDEILQLHDAAQSPARMDEALSIARRVLANDPPASYLPVLRQLMLQSMIRGKAPAKEIVSLVDTMDAKFDDRSRTVILGQVSQALLSRGEELDNALRFARVAYSVVPPGNANDAQRGAAAAVLGHALLEHGDADSARVLLESAAAVPESSVVLYQLGRAHEKLGNNTVAIDHYVRSLGVFPGSDSTALPAVRTLYKKEHKNLKGLDARIAAARKASKVQVALEGRRYVKDVPEWQAPRADGQTVSKANFSGKVVVMDFWGTWCGPCRMELPILQKTYERYKDRVEFITINWERGVKPDEHKQIALEYMRVNVLTMPVAFDYQYAVANAFQVQAFPTMLLIDRSGRIQYRNVGVDASIEKVVAAQIEDLLEARAGE